MQPASAEQRGHEPSTISLRGIIVFAIVFVIFAAIVQWALWKAYTAYLRHEKRQDVSSSAVANDRRPPPGPRLQPTFGVQSLPPREDLAAMRERENAEFVKRGWMVSVETNSAKVPDDLADKIAAQMSAPRASTATTQQGVVR